MGMFDDVLLKEVECQHCHKIIPEFNCQTKDFECTLDQFIQGDDVREQAQRWFLEDGSLGRYEGSWEHTLKVLEDPEVPEHAKEVMRTIKKEDTEPLTKEQILSKYGDKSQYKIHFWDNDKHWAVYKYCGLTDKNWSNIESMKFNCYGNCPECKTWNEFTATIRNHLFIGVETE